MRRLVLFTAAIAAALVAAAPARAANGDPYVKSCLVVVRSTGCDFNQGLTRSPYDVAASPDGRQLYITTNSTPSVLQIVDRDPSTGALTPRTGAAGCFGPAGSGCTEIPFSLSNSFSPAVSHDGRTLLISAGGRVAQFTRDAGDGSLAYVRASDPAVAYAVAFSPDDRFVYVRVQDGLVLLRADDLTQLTCYAETTANGCHPVAGLAGAGGEIGVSQDTVAVSFAAAYGPPQGPQPGGGVAVFNRDRTDGTLTQFNGTSGGCYSVAGKDGNADRCAAGPASLAFATVAAISPDGRSVYLGGPSSVAAFHLDANGALQPPAGCVGGAGCTPINGGVPTALDLLPTSDGLIVSAFGGVITFFSRNPATAALTQLPGALGCMNSDGSGGCTQLGGLDSGSQTHTFLAADPAGLNVFAASDTQGMLASIVRDYGPVCHSASVAVPFGTAVPIRLDCADPNGDPLSYSVVTGPTRGGLSAPGSGQVVYTPAAGFSGADQFTYEANARGVDSAPVTVALAVVAAPAPPPSVGNTNPPATPTPAPARRRTVGALVATRWVIHGTRFSLRQLTLSQLPKGWKAQIRCAGKHCPFKTRALKGKAKHGIANVFGSLKKSQRRFRAKQTIEVWVSAPKFNTKVARLVLKKGKIPSTQALCVAPGAVKPRKSCS